MAIYLRPNQETPPITLDEFPGVQFIARAISAAKEEERADLGAQYDTATSGRNALFNKVLLVNLVRIMDGAKSITDATELERWLDESMTSALKRKLYFEMVRATELGADEKKA